jgi:transcription elongation factor GreB
MGRYRPPAPPKSKYITPEGYKKLQDELDYLWRKKRPEVTKAVSEAAALGDRSENAEYIYGKKMLYQIDSRVRFLRKRLEGMKVVDSQPSDPNKVFFGAWVELEDEEGELYYYRIVGPDEFDDHPKYISMDSPMAKALMGKALDDEISVKLPNGYASYYITAISYKEELK